jgi:hypothetical protein
VRKEIILLDDGIIYLVEESDCVSHVHCFPKKEDLFLFLMRTMNSSLLESLLGIECALITEN